MALSSVAEKWLSYPHADSKTASLSTSANLSLTRAVLIVLAVGFAYRLFVAFNADAVSNDAAIFIGTANLWHEEGLIPAWTRYHQNPGYPALIALLAPLFQLISGLDPFYATQLTAQSISLISGLLISVWIVWLTLQLFGQHALWPATLAGCGWALLPRPAQWSVDVLSDMPCWAIYFGGLVWLISVIRYQRLWSLVGIGLLSAAAFYVRMEGGALVVIAGLMVLTAQRWPWRRRMMGCAMLASVFMLAVAPLAWAHGTFFHKKPLWPEQLRCVGQVEQPCLPQQSPLAVFNAGQAGHVLLAQTPIWLTLGDRLVGATARIIQRLGQTTQVVWLLLAMVGVAVKVFFKQPPPASQTSQPLQAHVARDMKPSWSQPIRRWPAQAMMLAAAIHIFALMRLYVGDGYLVDRHVAMLAVLIMPWAGLGLAWLIALICRSRPDWQRPASVAAILICIVLYGPWLIRPLNHGQAYIAQAGAWIRTHPELFEEGSALSHRPWFAYYAGRRWAEPAHRAHIKLDDLLTAAEQNRAVMLLMDPSYTLGRGPSGQVRTADPHLFENLPTDRFELVKTFPSSSITTSDLPRELRIYRIKW